MSCITKEASDVVADDPAVKEKMQCGLVELCGGRLFHQEEPDGAAG